MDLDEIGSTRESLFRQRQRLVHSEVSGNRSEGFREKYLAIRDREAVLRYEELRIENARSAKAKLFDRPRKQEKPNRRLRIWVNLLIIAMVLAVSFFFVITPRLTPTRGDAVKEPNKEQPNRESLPQPLQTNQRSK